MKRKWEKPELVVLIKSRPEDGVMMIAPCKHAAQAGEGSLWEGCEVFQDPSCSDCAGQFFS